MNLKRVALITLLCAPIVLAADKPSTQPSQPNRPYKEGGFKDGSGRMGMKRDGMGPRISQQEAEDIGEFLKKERPNLYKLYQRIPDERPMKMGVLQRFSNRYRQLMRMQDQNADAYQAMLQQEHLRDEALGYAMDMREGKEGAEQRLAQSISQMVEKNLTERQQQIMKLERTLEELKAKLKEDQENKQKVIDDQVAQTKQEMDKMLRGIERGQGKDPGDAGKEINALQRAK
jgi:hypothetical protein